MDGRHHNLFASHGSVAEAYEQFQRDQNRYFRMSIILGVVGLVVLPIAIVQSSPWLFALSAFGFFQSLVYTHDVSNCNYMLHMIDYDTFERANRDR